MGFFKLQTSNNMRKIILSILLVAYVSTASSQERIPVFRNKNATTAQRVEDLLQRMTVEEKVDLLSGYRDFYLHPCDRLGIPAFKLADGPLGLSSWGLFGKATAFPSSLSAAASWNRKLVAELGKMYAQEWRARGIHFLLAPGVNNYRASKGARNFEYYGEDPYLASEMVVPFIKNVQDGGVIATIKHYAVNDQEFDRYTVSSEIGERALREIYLPPFEAAVKRAGVKAVMTGYNPVNGVYCTENKYLIDILKKEWGFKGMLMSDWACTYSAVGAANHGLDLEMGSNSWFNRKVLLPLIESGEVPMEVIDDKVRRIYGTCIEMGFFDRPQLDTSIPTYNPEANRMALEGAREGIILLKNSNNTLPLNHPKTIAVIGPTANYNLVTDRNYNVQGITYGGGGSSKVHPWYVTSLLQGIITQFKDSKVLYHEGISNRFKSQLFRRGGFTTKEGKNGLEASYYKCGDRMITEQEIELMKQQAIASGRSIDKTSQASQENVQPNGELVKKQIDQSVNFEWWGAPHNLTTLGDNYRICWEGYITAEEDGQIMLFVDAQGGYKLWIDGRELIDASASSSFHFGQTGINVRKGDRKEVKLEYNNRCSNPSEIRFGYCYTNEVDFSEPLRLAAQADVVIFSGGLDGAIELEGRDRPFELPYGQDSLINELCKVNPNVVVNLIAGGGVNMTKWIDKVPAVLHSLYPGQEGGTAIAEIIAGKVHPSAKLPFTIERRWEDSPAYGNYDETRHEKKIYYREGIFTGYRGYDKKGVDVLFPFGYGLSYTTFGYDNLKIDVLDTKAKRVKVSFDVKNTGNRAGSEIVQLYVRDCESREERPLKELKGFDKVSLDAGESIRVEMMLDYDSFKYFNEKQKMWIFEPGAFEIWVGASSKDIRLKGNVRLK